MLRPKTRRGLEIAIICALAFEADAVDAIFDLHWDDDESGPPYDKAPGDPNAYSTGVIGRHNVVLAYMPNIGVANAAAVAANSQSSFPNIKLALVVGICGIVPFGPSGQELLLGDILMSDGIIQYVFSRQLPSGFARKDTLLDSLGRPNIEIRALLQKLRSLRERRRPEKNLASYLADTQGESELVLSTPDLQTIDSLKQHLFTAMRRCRVSNSVSAYTTKRPDPDWM